MKAQKPNSRFTLGMPNMENSADIIFSENNLDMITPNTELMIHIIENLVANCLLMLPVVNPTAL